MNIDELKSLRKANLKELYNRGKISEDVYKNLTLRIDTADNIDQINSVMSEVVNVPAANSVKNKKTATADSPSASYLDNDVTSKEYLDSLAETAYKNYAGLMVDPNGLQAQQYRTDMLNAINAEEAQYNATLNNLELDAYRQIGYQQQELENQIAENRLKAIKSGTTSAQLAAQQLNNMFAAQSGAAQIAQQAMNDRLSAAQQYSQMRNTGLTTGLYDTINNNRQALATTGAQNYAVMGSYGSYINSQLANIQANKALYDFDPKKYTEILNPVE